MRPENVTQSLLGRACIERDYTWVSRPVRELKSFEVQNLPECVKGAVPLIPRAAYGMWLLTQREFT